MSDKSAAPPKELARAFAAWLKTPPAQAPPPVLPPGVASLAYLGLPRLYSSRLVPGLAPRERWERERVVQFPGRCTTCERPPTQFASSARSRGWLRAPELLLDSCIPVCEQHARFGPNFWLEPTALGHDVSWNIVGVCPEFLADTQRLNQAGERLAPWQAFPAYAPESSGWRQGEGEYWLQASWRPFWSSLSAEQRRSYLERQPPPTAWKGALDQLPAFASDSTSGR